MNTCNRGVPLSGGSAEVVPRNIPNMTRIFGAIFWRFEQPFSRISPNIWEIFEAIFGIFGQIALRTSLPDTSNWFCNFEYPEPGEHPRTSQYPRMSPENSRDIQNIQGNHSSEHPWNISQIFGGYLGAPLRPNLPIVGHPC